MATTTPTTVTSPTMSPNELIDVSVTAWMFTDEDLSSESPSSASASATSASSYFSFSPSPSHSSCECSPPVSPLSVSPKRAKRLFQNIAKSPLIAVDGQTRIIDWRSYYNSLTPTTADMRTPPTLTPTPTTAGTKVGSPCSRKDSLDKPRLSVVIPNGNETPVEKTFARKRRAVPKPLTLWDFSNARGGAGKPGLGRKAATSLPGSPFILVKPVEGKEKETLVVETPCDILSAVDFDLHAALQSASQNIPVSVRKVREYEDQWKYYRDDSAYPSSDDDDFYYEDDDDYMSDPGTSIPDSALYTPFYKSPVQKKVLPAIQRGKQNPFPVRSVRTNTTTTATDASPNDDAPAPAPAPAALPISTVASRLDLLRQRYHDIKIATPVEQEAMKSALMSPAI